MIYFFLLCGHKNYTITQSLNYFNTYFHKIDQFGLVVAMCVYECMYMLCQVFDWWTGALVDQLVEP